MRRLWLIFAQACTVSLAILFVLSTLKPEWLSRAVPIVKEVVTLQEDSIPDVVPAAAPSSSASASSARDSATSTALPVSYAEAVRKAMPSVVNLYSAKEFRSRHPMLSDPLLRRFFGQQHDTPQKTFSLGSGVIVSPQGYILTNNHVVEGADLIDLVTTDGRRFTGKIVGTDPDTDLAVLKIDGDHLPAITLGNDEQLQVGDPVLAIGNPFGVNNTVTSGIVSAIGRNSLGINEYENFIQTDAAINPGNSGGALINASGNLVGINTAIFSRTGGTMGIGFAIPVSLARPVMEQIIESGQVTRGYMGVVFTQIGAVPGRPPARMEKGAFIRDVVPGGPAARAGLRSGDIVVAINGKPTDNAASLRNQISGMMPGTRAPLKVSRGGDEIVVEIEVAKRPKQYAKSPDDPAAP